MQLSTSNPSTFSSPPTRNTALISSQSPFPLPHSPSNNQLLSVSIDLPCRGILYKWNHKACGLSCLASFSSGSVFKVSANVVACINNSFLLMFTVPLPGYSIFHFPIHRLMGICTVSSFDYDK